MDIVDLIPGLFYVPELLTRSPAGAKTCYCEADGCNESFSKAGSGAGRTCGAVLTLLLTLAALVLGWSHSNLD